MNAVRQTHLAARLRFFFWLLTGVWTLCIGGSLWWNRHLQAEHILNLARHSAEVTFENELLYLRWLVTQGGVYARVSEHLPTNPCLHDPDRDVVTTTGVPLALVNAAYMARQVHAPTDAICGNRVHFTSLNPLRPTNAPDAWETAALQSCEKGAAEVSGVEQLADGEYLRLMRPFVVEQNCLQCHAVQGYKLGDVRGGASISVPLTPLRAIEKPLADRLALAHLGLWLVGGVGIGFCRRSLEKELLARQQAEAEREKFVSLADQSSEFIGLCDLRLQPLYVNPAGWRMVGLDSLEHARVTPVQEYFFPEDQQFIDQEFFPRVLREGSAEVEIRFRHFKSGEPLWMIYHVFYMRDAAGEPTGLATVSRNITARKQAEEQVRASLAEKEVLLKEIHHRVKNNLQVISSLVALQAQRLPDAALREVFQDMTHRVRSMALVHETLYHSADLARVELAEYVRSYLSYLWCARAVTASGIRLTVDLEPVAISLNAAVPCGLILNELVNNALKHAFRDRADGELTVSLHLGPESQVYLRVRDNGVGLPAGYDWRQADSLGLYLVQLLAGQLQATVEVTHSVGTDFSIQFGGPQPSV